MPLRFLGAPWRTPCSHPARPAARSPLAESRATQSATSPRPSGATCSHLPPLHHACRTFAARLPPADAGGLTPAAAGTAHPPAAVPVHARNGAGAVHRRCARAAARGRPARQVQGATGAGQDPRHPVHGQPVHAGEGWGLGRRAAARGRCQARSARPARAHCAARAHCPAAAHPQETLDYLRSVCSDIRCTRGDFDDGGSRLPDTEASGWVGVEVGGATGRSCGASESTPGWGRPSSQLT